MIKFREKRYSFGSKLKAGLNCAGNGAVIGGVLIPGNVILALFGKQKAALILTAIGAGIGAGIGFYWGWKGEKKKEDFEKKMKTDPEFKKKIEQERLDRLKTYIKRARDIKPGSLISAKDLDQSPIQYRPDAYHYLEVYDKFSKRYREEWIKAWENLKSDEDIDLNFEIVFPEPFVDEVDNGGYIAANGYSASDHYWIMWDEEKGNYNNDLGFGKGKGKTLLEACQNFASQWICPEEKIEREDIKAVAKIHNKIIREFLKLT